MISRKTISIKITFPVLLSEAYHDQNSSKRPVEEGYFSEVSGHLFVSLLKMDFFTGISEDFAYLPETPVLRNF